MRKDWRVATLGELYEITSSKRVFKNEWQTNGVPFYRAREIVKLSESGYVDNELFITENMFSEYSRKYGAPGEGDIMVTGVGTLGICYVVKKNDRFYFKDGNIIWLKSRNKANSRYVEYAFKSDYIRSQIDDSIGATVSTYTIIKAKNTKIPIPSLEEQKQIVAILDKAFAAIDKAKANAEQNLKNAKELFESYLNEVFENKGDDWQEKTLGEIANVQYGFTGKSFDEGNYRYVRITDIDNNGELILKHKKYLRESGGVEDYIIKDNDLLIVRTGATFAKVLLYKDYEESVFASYLIRLTFNAKIENELYWYFTKTRHYWEQANSLASGAAQPHFNGEAIKKIVFLYPRSISTQRHLIREFRSVMLQTRILESVYEQKLTQLEELKKSILQKAFNGELTNKPIPELA